MERELRSPQPPVEEQPESERDQGGPRLRISLLGQFQVSVDGRVVDEAAWQRRKARSLVKLLALAPRQRLHREEVLETLWPEQDPDTANANLRVILHAARRALQSTGQRQTRLLQHVNTMIVLQFDRLAWVDAVAFEVAAATAQRSGDAGDFQTALDLYAGELLPEDRYEDWTTGRRERLRDTYLTLLLGLAEALENSDDRASAIEALEHLIAAEPAHEEATTRLMLAYARSGQRHRALRLFQDLRRVLEIELDATPEPGAQRLYAEILAGDSSRLTNESTPESSPAGSRHNLRSPLTSFVGREDELARHRTALESSRLVTLTGAGGCGKTRLALATAQTLVGEFQDGVWFIDLAPLVGPDGLPQTVASVLNLTLPPATDETLALVEALRTKHLLLVMDNCEHLIDACARLAEQLLVNCPRLRVLATSREPLRVSGETVIRVPALRLPPEKGATSQQIAESDAVRLFYERASHLQPDFALAPATLPVVADICRGLDGMPLAIELAAARVPMFSIEELTRRLRDPLRVLTAGSRTVQPRQQTLRATLDWSYRLLDSDEQRLLGCLSVFAGGCELEAAEAIGAGASVDREDVLGLLAQLVDKSLVQVEPGDEQARYLLLETVRQYAAEQRNLETFGESLVQRHAGWFLEFAETAELGLLGGEQTRWLNRLDEELDNFRSALHTFERSGDVGGQLRLAAALVKMWWIRGRPNEGRRWLERGLASASGVVRIDDAIRARALQATGNLARMQGDVDQALVLLEECVAIQRKRGDEAAIADALDYLAQVLGLRGDLARALALAGEELELRRKVGDPRGTALCLGTLGELSFTAGDAVLSSRYIEESLPLYRAHGDEHSVAITLNNLGEALRGQGLTEEAAARFQESLVMFRALDATHGVAHLLANLGDIARTQGDHAIALLHYLEALQLFHELGYRQAALGVVGALAALDAARGQPERAVRLFGAEEALREESGFVLVPDQRVNFDAGLAAARQRLSSDEFEADWRYGRLLSLDDTVMLAATVTLSDGPGQTQTGAPGNLSNRERDVALLAARGLTNQQIAESLGMSVRTAETHLSNVLRKLGMSSRRELAS